MGYIRCYLFVDLKIVLLFFNYLAPQLILLFFVLYLLLLKNLLPWWHMMSLLSVLGRRMLMTMEFMIRCHFPHGFLRWPVWMVIKDLLWMEMIYRLVLRMIVSWVTLLSVCYLIMVSSCMFHVMNLRLELWVFLSIAVKIWVNIGFQILLICLSLFLCFNRCPSIYAFSYQLLFLIFFLLPHLLLMKYSLYLSPCV